jgi:hypothetical protein
MINITFKCQEKKTCQKVHNFHHYPTWFLVPIFVLIPIKTLVFLGDKKGLPSQLIDWLVWRFITTIAKHYMHTFEI